LTLSLRGSSPVYYRRSGASPGWEHCLGTMVCRLVTGARAQARAGNVAYPPPPPSLSPRTRTPPVDRCGHIRVPPSLTGLGNDQLSASEQGPSALLTSQLPISQSAQGLRDISKQDTSGRYRYVLAIRRARVVAWVHGALAEFIHPPSDSATPESASVPRGSWPSTEPPSDTRT
jgi:hypothetical protein